MKQTFKLLMLLSIAVLSIISCDKSEGKEERPVYELYIVNAPDSALFQPAETKSWNFGNFKAVTDVQVTVPQGWDAAVVDEKLSVTAPAENVEGVECKGVLEVQYTNSADEIGVVNFVVEVEFAPEGVSFELILSEVTSTSAILEVIPSDDQVRYYYDVCTLDDFNSVDGNVGTIVNEYLTYLQAHYPDFTMEQILEVMLSQGPDKDTVNGLPAATQMCFYAIAIDNEGMPASDPSIVEFETLQGGDPADCTFEMAVSEIRGTTVLISVVPSDNSVRYWYAVTPREGYPGDIPMMVEVKNQAAEYAAEVGMSLEEVIAGVTVTGPVHEYWYDLNLDTDYYLYAFTMDEQGNYLGDMYKTPFTTAMEDISDADIAIDYRYFDGDELYEYDPELYADAQGRVVVQVKSTPNEFAYDWAVAIAAGDYTDEDIFPYDATVNAILSSGAAQYNKSISQFYVNWSDCTILAFAADYSGYNGPLTRILVQPTKEGAAGVEELAPIGNNQAKGLALLEVAPVENVKRISFEIGERRIGRNFSLR